MIDVYEFLNEHFDQFVNWLEARGVEHPGDHADECIREVADAAGIEDAI